QYRQKIAWFLERIDLHNTALIKALVLGERAEVKRVSTKFIAANRDGTLTCRIRIAYWLDCDVYVLFDQRSIALGSWNVEKV
ncbi:hypothetical protein ACR9PT_14765, partial [Piscirickettsia salmonis]|uniref:hypothetical protein n=1 Tax=Piscirickettsia salmonis TaxID=1238 RepID=UPI003EB88C9A